MTRNQAWTVVGVVILAVAVVGIVHNLAQLGVDTGGLPSWAAPFGLGFLVGGRVWFRAGQYSRGYAHARGIRKSHFTAIRGGHR